jgi:signal transduction histidine kinase/ligand-binding sensor domain-containing protein/DNA-binding response OmpR family regulator
MGLATEISNGYRMKGLAFLFTAVSLVCSSVVIFGQDYRFKHVNASHGLSHNRVTSIYKDKTGFLWIATISGLNRYDGNTIKVYRHDPDDSTSLPHDDIRGLFESPDGRICIVTASGVCFYNPKDETFSSGPSQLRTSFGLPAENLNKIVKDNEGSYWFLLDDSGVVRYDPERKHSLHLKHHPNDTTTISSNRVTDIVQHPDKSYWLFHSNGVVEKLVLTKSGFRVVYRMYTFSKIKDTNSYFPGRILVDNDGDLWIYIAYRVLGVFLFDVKTQQLRHIHSKSAGARLTNDIVSGIVQDNAGSIWISTDHGGINVVDKKTFSIHNIRNHPENESSLSLNSITTMVKDNEGIIWVGTYKNGVSYYHENIKRFPLYNRYSEPYGLPYEDINRVVEDDRGNLWIGTNGGGLIHFNRQNGKFTTYRHDPLNPNSLSSDVIVSLFIDHQKKLWIGTYFGGLNCFDGKNFTRYKNDPSNPKSLSGSSVWEILEDSQKRLWIGTLDAGLNLFDRETKIFHPFEERGERKLYSPYIPVLAEDVDGNIWVGTSDGIFVLKKSTGKFVHYYSEKNKRSTLMDNSILCLYQDAKRRIWVGTLGGLSLFDKATETFRTFTRKDGLPHNAVITMLEDAAGNLWLTTPQGLTQMIFTESVSSGIRFRNYSEADGLQGNQFNEDAALRTRAGELIFGGAHGFNIFRPEEIGQNDQTSKVILTDFQLFNKSIHPLERIDGQVILNKSVVEQPSIVLPSSKNVFSIEFAVLNFIQPENNACRYKLEGFNEQWLVADSKSRKITFTNLDAGDYVLRVTAANNDGSWNEEGATLKIKVLPPFWKSRTAFILYVLVVTILLYVIRNIIQEREKMKYAVEQEREQTLRARELDSMKTKFFTNVSHEFRTPLTLILSPLETMIKHARDDEQRRYFELMRRNGKRLLNLVNQLLDFRKLEVYEIKLQPTEGDIIEFIRETVLSFSDLSEKKDIRLQFSSPVASLRSVFDHDKLEKILFNLLSNAFKFTLANGEVSVSLNLIEADQKRLLEINVRDTGIGISAEKKEWIFERFFQNDLPRTVVNQGSGIGLSITREFVRIHGGTIHVESELGKGSCFTIRLPLEETGQLVTNTPLEVTVVEPRGDVATTERMVSKGKPVVLLVEDNVDFRFYLKDNLKHEYCVLEADSGEEGWNKILADPPDIVVSDLMMPGISGVELCLRLKAHEKFRHIPIILLTARAADSDRLEGIESGADDYINKPFNFQILESRIRNLILQRAQLKSALIKNAGIEVTELNITSLDEQFLQKIVEVVEKNISNAELSVVDLYLELGVSRSRFFKRVHALTGKSPMEFIRNIRMRHAAQLLEKSQLSVSEVAYRVGFNNPRYFAKHFKEVYDVLPSAYASGKRKS